MKRVIKFRAWLHDGEVSHMVSWISIEKSFYQYNGRSLHPDGASKYTLMQYTGFNDKNDKEIYEGDIVRIAGEVIGVVEYQGTSFCIVVCGKVWNTAALPCEVIGNIYENPELLKEEA